MIRRVLIANRSEIALRIIRTCREMGIETVAVYSEADRDSLPVELADQAICIGPPAPKESYLYYQQILSAALSSACDAIHPGYGFLAENAIFAEACEAVKLTFIGPPAGIIRKMGDKTLARKIMKKANIPIVPGSDGPIANISVLNEEAERIGYPLLIKAAGGGGGRGMRVVMEEKELAGAYQQAVNEAQNAFADGRVYIERYLINPKHLEVQVLIDKQGNGVHLYERDCSIQRRHQKLIEESPSVCLQETERQSLCQTALAAMSTLGYSSVGTVEFLWDPLSREFYFMEVNTRIQVEHPVSEMITGIDLVRFQLEVANNKALPFAQKDLQKWGHAIECRINAEDHRQNFRPSPGKMTRFTVPGGPGVRVDTAAQCGSTIQPYYDSLIAKLICWGEDRPKAIVRMNRALYEFRIEGIPTSIPLCQWVLSQPEFLDGSYSTHFLDAHMNEVSHV